MKWALALVTGLLCVIAGPAGAVDASPPLADPVLQQRYLGLTHELRCVKCQYEAIADSPVDIAADLRREVREAIVAGQSDEQIRDLLVGRYGEFILFRPRWSARNALLWLAPGLMLLGGAFIGWRIVSRRGALLATDPSTVDPESEST